MHLAGQKIRQWREAQTPPLNAAEFGQRFGDPKPWPSRTVYGWETKGKIARAAVQMRLAELGICDPADWLTPAITSDEPESTTMSSDTHPFYCAHTHGFVRVATSTPQVRTADVAFNRDAILTEAKRAHEARVDLVVYPELCLSSYAIDDLHLQGALLDAVENAVADIVAASATLSPVLLIGAPLRRNGKIYNCALAIAGGKLLGVVPKSYLPNYREYYEKRWFAHGRSVHGEGQKVTVAGQSVPFGTDLIFRASNLTGFAMFVEICEDYWSPNPPSTLGALAGATILANLSASNAARTVSSRATSSKEAGTVRTTSWSTAPRHTCRSTSRSSSRCAQKTFCTISPLPNSA